MAPSIDPQLLEHRPTWLDKAYAIFDEMATSGNIVAEFRRAELRQLDKMLDQLSRLRSRDASASLNAEQDVVQNNPPSALLPESSMHHATAQSAGNTLLPSPISGILDELCFDGGLAASQIMDTVNSIDSGDNEWLSHAILEHSIW